MTHHLHTTFSDGKDSPETMLKVAVEKGWKALGFSDHAPVNGEDAWCMPAEKLDDYFHALQKLKTAWATKIEVLIGLEMDWRENSEFLLDPRLEYWIGSFHFFEHQDQRYAIDGSLDMVKSTLEVPVQGDKKEFVRRYYRGLITMLQNKKPPILGHLDLLKKHNASLDIFDPNALWYRDLVEETLDAVAQSGTVIEVNTGGMARGYTKEPFPSWSIIRRIRERSLPIQLNSDTHQAATIDFAYAEISERLGDIGFRSQRVLTGTRWQDTSLRG